MARRLGLVVIWSAVAVSASTAAWPQGGAATAGALEGLGQGMGVIGEALMQDAIERDRMLEQHRLEMERIERERQILEENRNSRRAQTPQPQHFAPALGPVREEDKRYAAEAAVELAHPGWTRIVQTRAFAEWAAKQPRSVQQLEDSERPEDAILMIDLFKRDSLNQ